MTIEEKMKNVQSILDTTYPMLKAEARRQYGTNNIWITLNYATTIGIGPKDSVYVLPERIAEAIQDLVCLHTNTLRILASKLRIKNETTTTKTKSEETN